VRAHTRVESGPGQEIPLLPRAAHPCILACAKGSSATSASRTVSAGAAWGFRLDDRGTRVQRQGGGLRPGRPSHQPPLGFSLSSSPVRAPREGGRRGRRRCVEPRRDAATPEHRRRAKDGDHNRRLEGRRGGRPRWGKEPSRSGNIHAAKDAYITVNIFATPPSTPSWPRLHRRPNVSTAAANFLSPPPCSLSCDGSATS
jgi:hypothetical protein